MMSVCGASPCGSRLRVLLLVALLVTAGRAEMVAGQSVPSDGEGGWATTGMSEAAFLSLNALLGGVTAGVLQAVRGGSFQDGFARGSLGGGVVYLGKRASVESFSGAGFLGREVAAVGSSIVRNASEARPSFETVMLPLGPVRLYLSAGAARPVGAKLDLFESYWIVYGFTESRLGFDAGASLSAGAAVFRAREWGLSRRDRAVAGMAVAGVIFLAPHAGSSVLPHEMVHVIQHDFAHRAWTEPLDHWLAGHLPREGFRDRLELNLAFPTIRWGVGRLLGDGVDSPWESEATFLGNRRKDGVQPVRLRPSP